MAELMPEEHSGYKPAGEIMSFEEQLLHMDDNIWWLSSAYLLNKVNNPANKKDKKTKAAVLKIIADSYNQAYKSHLQL